ncbi:hypothetical protein D3C86_1962580 [compost metagenome]
MQSAQQLDEGVHFRGRELAEQPPLTFQCNLQDSLMQGFAAVRQADGIAPRIL